MHDYLRSYSLEELRNLYDGLKLEFSCFDKFKEIYESYYNSFYTEEKDYGDDVFDEEISKGSTIRDDSIQLTKDKILIYAKFKAQGHSDKWADSMMYYIYQGDSEELAMHLTYHHFNYKEKNVVDADAEVRKHCEHLHGDKYFVDYYFFQIDGGAPNLEDCSQFSRICTNKLQEGYDEHYAKDYALAAVEILKGDDFQFEDFRFHKIDEHVFCDKYARITERFPDKYNFGQGTSTLRLNIDADAYAEKYTLEYMEFIKELKDKNKATEEAEIYTEVYFKGLNVYREQQKQKGHYSNSDIEKKVFLDEYVKKHIDIARMYGISGDDDPLLEICFQLEDIFDGCGVGYGEDNTKDLPWRKSRLEELEKEILNYSCKSTIEENIKQKIKDKAN